MADVTIRKFEVTKYFVVIKVKRRHERQRSVNKASVRVERSVEMRVTEEGVALTVTEGGTSHVTGQLVVLVRTVTDDVTQVRWVDAHLRSPTPDYEKKVICCKF